VSAEWTRAWLTAALVLIVVGALVVLLRPPPIRPRPPLEAWAILVAFGLACWLLPAVVTAWRAA
jgi:hypothetical protein